MHLMCVFRVMQCMHLMCVFRVLTGDMGMCGLVWDQDLDVTQPLRAVLKDAAAIFPADASMLVQVSTPLPAS